MLDALQLLKTRRSVKPREMTGPGPSPTELETILTIGARVPDHGKLAPWRFIIFEGDARARAGEVIAGARPIWMKPAMRSCSASPIAARNRAS